jgi:hypothetical protein
MVWHRLFPAGLVLLLFAVGCGQPPGYMRRPDARESDATMEDGFDPESDGSVSEDAASNPDGMPPPDAASCDAPRAVCAGSCVDVRSDKNNCGGCGVRCGASQACMGSRCVDGCPAPNLMCGASCVNAQTDRNHCGFCGNVCNASQNCVSGACTAICPSPNVMCGASCVNVQSDRNNCGSCGTVCAASQNCVSGACTPVCSAGFLLCGLSCVNAQTDRTNCGTCGNTCTASQNCVSGTCTEICPAPTRYCGGVCLDVRTDRNNCGSCGNVCLASQNCVSGSCTDICTAPTQYCSGTCVNVQTDRGNCGACGNACTATQNCSSGVCTNGAGGCFVSAPQVLIYGPAGTLEQPYLPTGALVTVATEAMWRSFTTVDFRRYKVIVIGDLNSSGPPSTALQTLYDTRLTWGPAVDGRVLVQTIDPGYHAMPSDGGTARPGAQTVLRTELQWLAQGPGTALYVSAGGGVSRSYDYLSPLGTFVRVMSSGDLVSLTTAGNTHPAMGGSTSASLSNWSSAYHAYLTSYPGTFTSLATVTGMPASSVVVARDASCF